MKNDNIGLYFTTIVTMAEFTLGIFDYIFPENIGLSATNSYSYVQVVVSLRCVTLQECDE